MLIAVRAAVLSMALVTLPLISQTFRAQMSGVVSDPSGASIAGSSVTVTNTATAVSQKVVTNAQGIYLVPNIDPGQYMVSAEASGFKTFVQGPITAQVGASLTFNISLQVGDMAEKITVVGEAPLVEGENASFGQVISQRSIEELPLNSRNPMILVTLSPGVITSDRGSFSKDGIGATDIEEGRDQYSADFAVGGGKTMSNEILLDGAPNTSVDRGYMAYIPPVDSTQEFKVEANAFSAEYDRTTGGVVNLVTKGGTNEFHGTVYEFYRNSSMDANDFFFNRAGRTGRPQWTRNQFGGNFGGPLRKGKTFFFANYEGLRQAIPFIFTATVPTDPQKRGDFSQTRRPTGQLITIYDPLSTQRLANGSLVRQPFAGNAIPQARIDRVGAAVIGYYPKPNTAGDPVANTNNYLSSNNGKADMDNYGFRLDHNIGQVNRLFGRFSSRQDQRTAANRFDEGNPASNNGAPLDKAWNVTLSDIHTFSATMTGELRASFARHHTTEISPSFGFDNSKLGLPANYVSTAYAFFPKVNVADAQALGRDRYYDQARDTASIQGNVTKLSGRHSIKGGFDYRVPRFHLNRNLNSAGTFAFNRGMTQGPNPLQANAGAGFGTASLLLGAGASGNVTHHDVFSLNRKYYGFYFQDNFKLSKTFTLNLGIRYNLEVGQNESHDRMVRMNLEAPNPLAGAVGLPLRGVLEFAGDNGVSRNLLDTDKNNFSPRIGFAWQPTAKMSVRAGYGIFYSPVWISAYDVNVYAGYNSTTQWVTSLDGLQPLNYLSNPFPQGFDLPKRDRNPLSNVGQPISGWVPYERVGYSQQWNLSVQRQVGGTFMMEAAYWANKGTKMENRSGWQMNWLPNQYLALGTALNQLVANPFYRVIPTGPLSSAQVARRQLLLPHPQYTSVVRTGPAAGNSTYHAFTFRTEKRWASGLSFLANYTISKMLDDYDARPLDFENRSLEKSLSVADVPQRVVASAVYDLPLGRQKRFGAAMHPLLDGIVGGWAISGIATFQSGLPVSVGRPDNNGSSAQLPDEERNIDRWFNTSVFTPSRPFTFGTTGRYLPDVRTHGVREVDLVASKNFRIKERYRIRFRAEFFNAFNTPRFGDPNGAVTNAAFGTVRTQVNRPRSIQFGVHMWF